MENVKILQELKDRLTSYLSAKKEIIAVFLFGSQACGYTHGKSDIDIAVLTERGIDLSVENELGLSVDITNLFYGKEIDLVILNKAPVILAYRIINEGQVIFNRDDDKLADFVEETLDKYLDFKYVHETYQNEFKKELKSG